MIFLFPMIRMGTRDWRASCAQQLTNWRVATICLLLIGSPSVAQEKMQTASLREEQLPIGAKSDSGQTVGAGSCTAAGCHGGGHSGRVVGSEYNVWIAQDPHARAYSVLFDERSQNIVRLLDGLVDAQKDSRCIACHSMTDAPPRDVNLDVVSDGVGCEACHGPASNWLSKHYEHPLNSADRQRLGMWETKDLLVRAQICAHCHVGGSGQAPNPRRDVNHDLIAAGHPRLQFEMSAYHQAMPKHWSVTDDRPDREPPVESRKDFDALVWAVGQACASQAALEQLATRADDEKKTWPEFSEWSCSACHHVLRGDTEQRPGFVSANERPGHVIDWDNWNHYGTRLHTVDISKALGLKEKEAQSIQDAIGRLDREMGRLSPNRKQVVTAAREAALLVKDFAMNLERVRFQSANIDQLSNTMLDRHIRYGVTDWSSAVQVYDALASLQQSQLQLAPGSDSRVSEAIHKLYEDLDAKDKSAAAYIYKPEQTKLRLTEIQSYLPKTESGR